MISAAINGLKLGVLVSLTQISHAAYNQTPVNVYLVNRGYDVTIICTAALIMYWF